MTEIGREERAFAQLLRVARMRAEDLQKHLAGLEGAHASADNAIRWLAEAVAAEERGTSAAPAALDFGRFLQGAEERRRALEATRESLGEEIGKARETLLDAFSELKKLEHLVEAARRSTVQRERRAEVAAAGDLAAMRQRRRLR